MELKRRCMPRGKERKPMTKELGVKDATRFVMEYEPGSGDYTKTRKKLFRGKSVSDIVRDMKKKK